MRKKYSLLLLAGLSAMAFNSCKNEEDVDTDNMKFEASFEGDNDGSELKTTLVDVNGAYYDAWTIGDALMISDGSNLTKFVTTDEGRVRASFRRTEGNKLSEEDGTTYYAYYPASGCVSYAGDSTFNITLPRVQKYNENGTVSIDAYPMIGKSNTFKMPLYNLGSILKIHCTCESPVTIDSITVTSTEKNLSGAATASYSNGEPILTMASGNTNDIKLDCGAGVIVDKNGKDFFVVIPPAIYTGGTLSFKIFTPFVSLNNKFSKDFTFVRSKYNFTSKAINVIINGGENGESSIVID